MAILINLRREKDDTWYGEVEYYAPGNPKRTTGRGGWDSIDDARRYAASLADRIEADEPDAGPQLKPCGGCGLHTWVHAGETPQCYVCWTKEKDGESKPEPKADPPHCTDLAPFNPATDSEADWLAEWSMIVD